MEKKVLYEKHERPYFLFIGNKALFILDELFFDIFQVIELHVPEKKKKNWCIELKRIQTHKGQCIRRVY